jgi:FAD/FMN-containing dehydrogenase
MVCRAGTSYSGDDDVNFRGKNWNGDVQFAPAKLARPRDLESLVELVAKATEDNQPLHVIGSGWSFEDCASSDGVMVSLNWLTRRLSYLVGDNRQLLAPRWTALPQVGPGGRLVHFEAGIRIAALCEELDALHLALPTLGGSNGQALAGVISTSTHGGDWNQPPFPDIVRAVHLVFAGGQEVWIESDSDPLTRPDADQELLAILPCPDTKIVRNDRIFDAVRVACGRFGVMYSVVLEVRTQFRVAQVVTTPSRAAVMQALRDGQSGPSVFTPLLRMLSNDPVPAGMSDARGVPYFFQVLFNALRPSDVWVTRRWETPGDLPDSLPASAASMKDIAIGVTVALHTALGTAVGLTAPTTATVGEIVGALIGLPGLGAVISATTTSTVVAALTETTARLDTMIARGNFNAGVLIASAIDSLWKIPGMSALIAEIEYLVLNGRLPRTGRGPHYLMTSGTRADSDQTDFVSDSLEVVFDTSTAAFIDFLDEVLAVSPLFPQAGYVSLRPSLSSKASLSMHNVAGARAVSFELASIKPIAGNFAWLLYCHHAAVRRNGRPHWGQFNKMQALDTAMLYGDSLNSWREGLLALERVTQQASSTIFSNAFTRQRGLEPLGIARDVTSVKKKRGTITHLCNDGASWSPVTVEQAIEEIRAGTVHYFARRDDSRAAVKVVRDGQGGFRLRTVADNTSRNNLDELPVSTL